MKTEKNQRYYKGRNRGGKGRWVVVKERRRERK